MADRKLYDYEGNAIPTEPAKKLYNFEGEPLKFQNPLPSDNTIGRHLVEALPMVGAIAGGTLGPLGGAAGTGLGTMVKQALQKVRPDLLGASPSGGEEIAADTGKELLFNNVLPGILGKVGNLATRVGMQGPGATAAVGLSRFPAVREGAVKRMSAQIQEALGGGNYQPLGDIQPIKVTENTVPFQPIKFGEGTIGTSTSQARTPQGTFTTGRTPGTPRRFSTTNVTGPVEQVPSGEFSTRVTGPVKPGEDKLGDLLRGDHIDAGKAFDELTGKDAVRYADSMTPGTYEGVKDLLDEMRGMQKKTTLDRIITYRQGRLVWGVGMGALAALGHPGTALLGEAVREGPVILNGMLDRIMANPETAKLVTAALRTSAKAPQADLINKALTVALPRLFLEGAGVDTTK